MATRTSNLGEARVTCGASLVPLLTQSPCATMFAMVVTFYDRVGPDRSGFVVDEVKVLRVDSPQQR